MQELNIHDLKLVPLKQITDTRGAVFHYLKSDDENFKGFGEAYYSKVNPGVIKGWKLHNEIHQHFCVPIGAIEIVVYDGRSYSKSYGVVDRILLNDDSEYARLSMPPKLWYSFKCISENYSLLANIINKPHTPGESQTCSLDSKSIPYEWK